MEKEIIILCNSPQCLAEISSGNWPNLHERDLFTCNLAYSHFRTTGKHYNMFADAIPIQDFLENRNWVQVYHTYKYENILYVFNRWQWQLEKYEAPKISSEFAANYIASPIVVPASSAISALFYLNACHLYEKIHLVGYTINEWQGLRAVKELQHKVQAFEDVLKNYEVEQVRPFVYTYSRKPLQP